MDKIKGTVSLSHHLSLYCTLPGSKFYSIQIYLISVLIYIHVSVKKWEDEKATLLKCWYEKWSLLKAAGIPTVLVFVSLSLLFYTYSATNSSGVQVEKSAFGIHFRFIGVSRVTGTIATDSELGGSPLFSAARDLVSWCTAAFAIPYPIMPEVSEADAMKFTLAIFGETSYLHHQGMDGWPESGAALLMLWLTPCSINGDATECGVCWTSTGDGGGGSGEGG